MNSSKIREFFKANIGYISVLTVSAIYVMSAILRIDKTGKTVSQIFVDGGLAMLLGFFISKMFDIQGIISGEKDEEVQKTLKEHSNVVIKISPYMDMLDAWCEEQNRINLKNQRTRMLAKVGLKYSDYFDESGKAKNFDLEKPKKNAKLKRLWKIRLKAYYKAIGLSLTNIAGSDLTSDSFKEDDPFYFGRTKIQYERQTSFVSVFSRLCTALIFGYYGVKIIDGFSWLSLLWTGFQVSVFILIGVYKMYQSILYVTDEYKDGIVKKTEKLLCFENYIKKNISEGDNTENYELR